ncbi:MAG: hypothetical protein Q8K74_01250 [Candidatus Nitrotoga sp.]|nr:hypothetical protein [Candidatus Nitrotoga sp.]MDP1854666.1 hypothetical protein [Candidatus Nitrotoga sp.]
MNVIDVPRKINFILALISPIPPLPQTSRSRNERPAQRIVSITRRQAPYRVQVFG